MIRKLENTDRQKIYDILVETNNFNGGEIKVAMELIDFYISDKEQKDYEIFVDAGTELHNEAVKGYVCIGPRPLTAATYDLYWIAVNPSVQSKGIGSGLISYIENYLTEKKVRLILIETSGKLSYEKERKFYEKNKYGKLAGIQDFYDIGDSLVIYGKYL